MRLDAPAINLGNLPEAERDIAAHKGMQLQRLAGQYETFQDCLKLHRFSEREQGLLPLGRHDEFWILSHWSMTAARDAAMTVYQMGRTIEGLRSSFNYCPTLSGLTDAALLRTAESRFKSNFPAFIQIRHAISHASDARKSVSSAKETYASGRIGQTVLKNTSIESGLMDGKFTSTFDGQVYTLEFTEEAGDKLREIVLLTFEAFKGAT